MRLLLVTLTLLWANAVTAQSTLNFNKHFVECEDKWVAFQKDEDSACSYGFIYIDEQAGLTFNSEGKFKINAAGVFIPEKWENTSLKVRLEPNDVLVALIPENKFAELNISAVPEWLKIYKQDSNSIARLYKWGFMYNGWNQCAKALTYLEKAQKTDPNYKGLSVELAYSYNCLEQYNKAITVLESALKIKPDDAYTNKELIYAEIKSGQLDKAAKSCSHAIATCSDKTYHGENCYNLLAAFYQSKDKENFNSWLAETKKWNADNAPIMKNIDAMKNQIDR